MSRTRGSSSAPALGLLGAALGARRRSPWPRAPDPAAALASRASAEPLIGRPRFAALGRQSSRRAPGRGRRPPRAPPRPPAPRSRAQARKAVEEVDGPVERVDDPAPAAAPPRCGSPPRRAGRRPAARPRSSSRIDPLGLAVGVRDRIRGGRLRLEPLRRPAVVRSAARSPAARAARSASSRSGAHESARTSEHDRRRTTAVTTTDVERGSGTPPARSGADSASR